MSILTARQQHHIKLTTDLFQFLAIFFKGGLLFTWSEEKPIQVCMDQLGGDMGIDQPVI